ncbi:MAG: methylated-DNA-protein-cysteine methyltransferase-like protein [Candidatus Aldehydirespiratoraceae bacterium]|jgi:methylated-DNA-protein-cysteine methyltransferase-like protein
MDPADRSTWTDFERAVGAVLDQLEPGDLVTYGDVATEAGFPGAARAVGSVLRRSEGVFPWWRVVSASGRLLTGHEQMQMELLAAEGIEVRGGRIRG